MKFKPHKYQKVALDHVLDNPRSGLFLDMGLGKTVTTLSALEILMNGCEVHKPLIIAPKLVTEQTWSAEIEKWDHTKHFKISRIIGTEKERIAALNAKADIYVVSRDNIAWLVRHCLKQKRKIWPFDMGVIDESSSFKNPASMRFKALRKVAPLFKRIIILTGTPAPNSLLDIWAQMYLVDQGERLGRTLTQYRTDYFIPNYNGFGYEIRENAADMIHGSIKDICISMKASDYLDLPPRLDIVKPISLRNYQAYQDFKEDEVLKLSNGEDITPLSAAALYSKLAQFCNGAVYDTEKVWHLVDQTKLDTIVEDYESLNGEPVIIFYSFRSDIERLMERIPEAQMIKNKADIERWNRGEIKCLIAHPASMGHGLNLQEGGSTMFWMGLPWSLELYQQAIARLDRQGQKNIVRNFMYVASGTIEEKVAEALASKEESQNRLFLALKAELFGEFEEDYSDIL